MIKRGAFFTVVVAAMVLYPALTLAKGYIDLSKLVIPGEFGSVKEVYQPPSQTGKDGKIVFHIQDVHTNYEAQKNLANILEYLVETYGIELVLVEGGITDKDFSYIREWATLDERQRKADDLLREGIISGETYVDIATDLPLKFQGIEDKGLYEENMEIYLKVDGFREAGLEVVGKLSAAAEGLKRFIYTKSLKELDELEKDYKTEKIGLVEYIEALEKIKITEGMELKGYENYDIVLGTSRLEKGIDFNLVGNERDNLIAMLNSSLSKENLGELIAKSLKFKEDKMSAGEYYFYLCALAEKEGIISKKLYKNLALYVDYIATYEKLKRDEFFKELNEIRDKLSEALCKTEEQKRLFMISNGLSILTAFLRLKLSPEDFDYYKAKRGDFDLGEWKGFLKKHLRRLGIETAVPEDTSVIDENLEILEGFYDTAFKRDRAFLKNSLDKMEKEKEGLAVLITGGFHTANLTSLFKDNGISYVVITPKLTKETDTQLYDRILKESYRTRTWGD